MPLPFVRRIKTKHSCPAASTVSREHPAKHFLVRKVTRPGSHRRGAGREVGGSIRGTLIRRAEECRPCLAAVIVCINGLSLLGASDPTTLVSPRRNGGRQRGTVGTTHFVSTSVREVRGSATADWRSTRHLNIRGMYEYMCIYGMCVCLAVRERDGKGRGGESGGP